MTPRREARAVVRGWRVAFVDVGDWRRRFAQLVGDRRGRLGNGRHALVQRDDVGDDAQIVEDGALGIRGGGRFEAGPVDGLSVGDRDPDIDQRTCALAPRLEVLESLERSKQRVLYETVIGQRPSLTWSRRSEREAYSHPEQSRVHPGVRLTEEVTGVVVNRPRD